MNEIHTSRFKDAPWFAKEEINTLVGGAGGIGSWLTILLARAGFTPIVYDFDRIEEHNLAGQMYSRTDAIANKLKVQALKENCKSFADTDINIMAEKITDKTMSHNYVFSAFDNMQARKDTFEGWKNFVKDWRDELEPTQIVDVEITEYNVVLKDTNNNKLGVVKLLKDLNSIGLLEAKNIADAVTPGVGKVGEPYIIRERIDLAYATTLKDQFEALGAIATVEPVTRMVKKLKGVLTDTPIFIDGRLIADQYTVYTVLPGNEDRYRETLFDDADIPAAPCTYKQTSHFGLLIGARITNIMLNFITNKLAKEDICRIPFSITEYGSLILTKTEK